MSPMLAESINKVQTSLLRKLGLIHQTYTAEIVPKLLLTLDRKRLKPSDTINIGDMVLIHTSELRAKHSKAVLAEVVAAPVSRDGVRRVAVVQYFKHNSCRLINNRLVGRPIQIVRGVETLSRLNQSALQPCKVSEYLHRQCRALHPPPTPPPLPPGSQQPDPNLLPHEEEVEHLDHSTPLSTLQLDPDIHTTVWLNNEEQEDSEPHDHTAGAH